MEYGLRHVTVAEQFRLLVLILVVMEYGLRLIGLTLIILTIVGLNPCCNGIWSQTLQTNLN